MAKRKQPRRQGGKNTPVWAWLLVGLFVGALAYFAYRQYLSISADATDVPIPQDTVERGKKSAGRSSEPTASSEEDGVLDTDYSFYDVLPTEENIDIPVDETQPVVAAPASAPENSTAAVPSPATVSDPKAAADNSRYLLQAGSFERAADADDLKARIAMSGEAARVETAEVNGKTMHRVRLGPYADITAANAAKANLAGQGIKSVSIKIEP